MTFVQDAMARLSDPTAMGEVAIELRARWHRAKSDYDATPSESTRFATSMRMVGIDTSLALLLGIETKVLRKMLLDEHATFTSG